MQHLSPSHTMIIALFTCAARSPFLLIAAASAATGASIHGTASFSATSSSSSSSSSSSDAIHHRNSIITNSSIHQQYEELCALPKTCSIDNDDSHASCLHDVLRGLAATQHQMQQQHQSSSETNNEAAMTATIALKLHLSQVRLEEASVGCAIYYANSIRRKENGKEGTITTLKDDRDDAKEIICPVPKTCNMQEEEEDNEDEAIKRPPCNELHYRKMKTARDAQEAHYFDKQQSLNSNYVSDRGRLAMQWELAESSAEVASVGCTLFMRHARELANANKASASAANNNHALLQPFIQNAEKFDRFLERNFKHFLKQPHHSEEAITKSLLRDLGTKRNEREQIEFVLTNAGRGDIPEIIWQERVSRERAVERLHGEERLLRSRLLDTISNIGELDFEEQGPYHPVQGPREDERNLWEIIAEDIERRNGMAREEEKEEGRRRMTERREVVEATKMKEGERYPGAAPVPPRECNTNNGDEASCTVTAATDPPSSKSHLAMVIQSMKNDIDLLRNKAANAYSQQERDARLRVVRDMERQVESLLERESRIGGV